MLIGCDNRLIKSISARLFSMTRYAKSDLQNNASAKSLWVSLDDNIYDITPFIDTHPGGKLLLLKYAGKDIKEPMIKHSHSQNAYTILSSFKIGTLINNGSNDTLNSSNETLNDNSSINKSLNTSTNNSNDNSNDSSEESSLNEAAFIDPSKPMLAQVYAAKFSKKHYLKHIHIPHHLPYSAPIFGSKFLEPFTKTYWWGIPLFWAPWISYTLLKSINLISPYLVFASYIVGLLFWTFIEYSLHRFLFHMDDLMPDHPIAITLHL